MKNDLDATKVLQAYECVMNNGTPTEFGKMYEGVEAFSDYDGYNVFLRANGVELKVGSTTPISWRITRSILKTAS